MRENVLITYLKERGNKPRFHGNGFTQLYLNEDTRLHIWDKRLPPLRNHNVLMHNHRYDLVSKVYTGCLNHTVYDLEGDGEHDYRVIQLEGASAGFLSPELETGITGELRVRSFYNLAAGSEYSMRRPYFHSSTSDEPQTVTIMRRYNFGKEWAQVLCPIDEPIATHAFAPETQPSEDTLWEVISDAVTQKEAYDLRYELLLYTGRSQEEVDKQ